MSAPAAVDPAVRALEAQFVQSIRLKQDEANAAIDGAADVARQHAPDVVDGSIAATATLAKAGLRAGVASADSSVGVLAPVLVPAGDASINAGARAVAPYARDAADQSIVVTTEVVKEVVTFTADGSVQGVHGAAAVADSSLTFATRSVTVVDSSFDRS